MTCKEDLSITLIKGNLTVYDSCVIDWLKSVNSLKKELKQHHLKIAPLLQAGSSTTW